VARVLFVVSDRALTSIAAGGSGAVFEGLLALLRERGDRVHVLLLRDAARSSRFEVWKEVDPAGEAALMSWLESVETVEYETPGQPGFFRRKLTGLLDPQLRAYPFLASGISDRVPRVVDRVNPGLVIAADLPSGLVCSRLTLDVPVVYYHHDFFWRINKLKAAGARGSLRGAWGWSLRRRAEGRVIRSADLCITGSTTEAEALSSEGARAVALVPPVVTSQPVSIPGVLPEPCRIVHLGGLRTTATRLGLQRLLEVVWPVVRENAPNAELWVVGDTSVADRDMRVRLEEAGATATGFVRDLSDVLRPGDLHIIPWEFATGVRTRVLTCFLHGQALVAVGASVAGYEGLENGKHCVLVNHLEESCDPLIELAFSPRRRLELGRAGQEYLRQRLTVDAVLPHFNEVMEGTLRNVRHRTDLQ